MAETPIWKKPASERAAAFAKAFAGIEPAEHAVPPLRTQLRSVSPMISKKRREGFSVEQICARLKDPAIGIEVTPVALRRFLANAERKRALHRKAKGTAPVAVPVTVTKSSAA